MASDGCAADAGRCGGGVVKALCPASSAAVRTGVACDGRLETKTVSEPQGARAVGSLLMRVCDLLRYCGGTYSGRLWLKDTVIALKL